MMKNDGMVRALSIRQPWAELIARGEKTLEVRSWSVTYRGPLVVVSSAARVPDEDLEAHRLAQKDVAYGVTVCLADLIDVREGRYSDARAACCDVDPSEFVWVLENVRRLEPRPIKGRVSLYSIPQAEVVLGRTAGPVATTPSTRKKSPAARVRTDDHRSRHDACGEPGLPAFEEPDAYPRAWKAAACGKPHVVATGAPEGHRCKNIDPGLLRAEVAVMGLQAKRAVR